MKRHIFKDYDLSDFVVESNIIERVSVTTEDHVAAWDKFLATGPGEMHIGQLQLLVAGLQPDAQLRERPGLDVRVGNHFPTPGGPKVRDRLLDLLVIANEIRHQVYPGDQAYKLHHEYETLHPFTDCNGRSGRALWLWTMGGVKRAPLGFLHTWYYQSLRDSDIRRG